MFALFDIGGTKTRIAFSSDGEIFEEPVIIETPQTFEEGIEVIARTVKDLSKGREVRAVVGGIAGPLNQLRTELVRAPHLQNWVGRPIQKALSESVEARVFLQNDSALVGLGEARFGAGNGNTIVAYITVSTGVGGVRIVDGQIDRGQFGFEPGHQIINANDNSDDALIDLDGTISGEAIERRFGKKPYEISQSDALWDELARWLAIGLANTIVHWSPDVVVLGGSMMVGDPKIPIENVRKHLEVVLKIFPEHSPLALATLGAVGGLHGALAYAKTALVGK
ncbi:MAG TPA: ROK family protein [Candidatus Paceibacterota bacterium]|jgi:glucokinase